MYEILYKRVCARTFCSFPAEASSQPKCLTPADTASCTERKTVKSRTIKVKWDGPGAEAEAALTSLWSPWWNHLCPWWDTLSSVLTGSCTGASSQTLGWNPSSPGRLRLNRQTFFFLQDEFAWTLGVVWREFTHGFWARRWPWPRTARSYSSWKR